MAFRFKRAACVVAGTFNMYIVQPAWLVKVGIIPKGTEVAIATKLDEPGFRFSSQKLPMRWFVTPQRIEVETQNEGDDCGQKVAEVLRALPWTPLVALGNNFIYVAPLSDLDLLPQEIQRSPDVPSGYEITQRSLHFAVAHEERAFNLQLSITGEEIELSVNVHTELRKRDSGAACAAASRFLHDLRDAESLARHFFKASIEHGNSNA